MTSSITPSTSSSTLHCPNCNAALAADQRYCLNCGQRLAPPRVEFEHALGLDPAPAVAPEPVKVARTDRFDPLQAVIAAGAVLLALGVGIVIGRGNGSSAPARAQIVTVQGGAAPTSGTLAPSAAQPVASVSDDWAAGTSAYTIELGTLDKTGATAATVAAAKSQASGKGASAVGALDGDAHSGTPTGKYVIYSGQFSSKKEADAALAKLKKNFPTAILLHVTPQGGGNSGNTGNTGNTGSGGSGNSKSGGNAGANTSAANSLKGKSGNAYVKQSAKLPSTIGTGTGAPPPKDNKKAGAGSSGTCIGC